MFPFFTFKYLAGGLWYHLLQGRMSCVIIGEERRTNTNMHAHAHCHDVILVSSIIIYLTVFKAEGCDRLPRVDSLDIVWQINYKVSQGGCKAADDVWFGPRVLCDFCSFIAHSPVTISRKHSTNQKFLLLAWLSKEVLSHTSNYSGYITRSFCFQECE